MRQVSESSLPSHFTGLARLKLFFALSRTPHGLLDMCTPAFGALLWLGHFPPVATIVIGIITTFAGYTAVYALNDVVDYNNSEGHHKKHLLCNPYPQIGILLLLFLLYFFANYQ